MAQKKLLTTGNAFQRTDKRWCGVVWYLDEKEERKRKSFSGNTKAEVTRKMKDYVAAFDKMVIESDESKKTLEESMGNWLRVFKFPSVERGSYDRLECTAKHQVYPLLGKKVVGNVTSADIQKLLNHWMNEGYAYNTVKKAYNLLTDYFRHLTQQELIQKNPMATVPMIKKANFMAAQGRENLPTFETVTTFTPEEIDKFKAESYRTWSNGERIYQQASAYTLMFNTGLRTGEALGPLNSDIDLDHRVKFHALHNELFDSYDSCRTYSTSLEDSEIGSIAAFLNMSAPDFADKYLSDGSESYIIKPPCPFFESDGKCASQDCKPEEYSGFP